MCNGNENILETFPLDTEIIFYQDTGDLTVERGTLTVSGDYRMQSLTTDSSGAPKWDHCPAALIMQYPEDCVTVGGAFIHQSIGDRSKTTGTLSVASDFPSLESGIRAKEVIWLF